MMKNSRAYVINLHTLATRFLVFITLICMISLCFTENIRLKVVSSLSAYMRRTEHISDYFPVLKSRSKTENNILSEIIVKLIGGDFENPARLITANMPFIKSVKNHLSDTYSFVNESRNYIFSVGKRKEKEEKNEKIKYNPTIETTIKSIVKNGSFLEKKGITLNNKAGYTPSLEALYNGKLNINRVENAPQILIVHTHGSESYNPTDRTENTEKNVVRLGREMKKIFEENKIGVIHSEKMHDIPRYNNSYNSSLATVNQIISENPTINIVLDIHRDAMINDKGDVFKTVAEVNGEKAAQVMFVVGTDKNGLSHPDWQENLKFAIKCQEEINKRYPNLVRPVDLRSERFNQHTTKASVIIEIGTNGNTLDEALLSAKLTAEIISDIILKKN